MAKRLKKRCVLKNNKKCKVNILDIKFVLRGQPFGDTSAKHEFSAQDLEYIMLLDNQSMMNTGLIECDEVLEDKGDIYSLMAEGVLVNQPTGADLGIYNYPQDIVQKVDYSKYIANCKLEKIDECVDEDEEDNFLSNDDWDDVYNFGYCLLAENNPLGDELTKTITTFKGYLEISATEGGIIRKCNCDNTNSNISKVCIFSEYINKYKLRNGDEIVCTCIENDGKMVLSSLMSINQVSYFSWDCNRPWFNDLKNAKAKKIDASGDYLDTIKTKFGLNKGDNTFLYINKNTQKDKVLNKLIFELSGNFDKVIYINPQYRNTLNDVVGCNIIKFCANFNDWFYNQQTVALLGINHAKRMVEMGQNVAVVVDDMDAIAMLDKDFQGEMPICKTILGSAKVCKEGSITSFTLVSLRADTINTFSVHNLFKSAETLGVVIDNNEVDIFNSYRI